jgi:imidazolonepropionase-like amidohydrolase
MGIALAHCRQWLQPPARPEASCEIIDLRFEAGFTPEQAVQIMTVNGAKVLGIDNRVGTVAAGKQADLLVIKGDLSKDPGAIKQITTVFREGAGYDPERLLKTVRGLIGVR